MLILHHRHPRSIRFSASEVQAGLAGRQRHHAGLLTPTKPNGWPGKVVERLRYDRVDEIFKQGLHSYLDELLRMCGAIGEDIARTYFYYAVVA